MSAHVLIVATPSPAGCASNNTWRAAAELVHQRLVDRFGSSIDFEYAELFTEDLASRPEIEALVASGEAVPPLVFIDGDLRFAGGKLRVSAIERAVAQALQPPASTAAPKEQKPHA